MGGGDALLELFGCCWVSTSCLATLLCGGLTTTTREAVTGNEHWTQRIGDRSGR